jgi:hypothetical protein
MRFRVPRAVSVFSFAVAALSAALAVQMLGRDPRSVFLLIAFGTILFVPSLVGRLRMRRLLMSGDVERVIGTWVNSISRVRYPETMTPLLHATAYAAYGWNHAARRALERAAKGPAWDAAIEQRLFIETLLDTFEGDRETAVSKATRLQALPIPSAGFMARRRIAALRSGLGALARAFAHASREGDARALERAAAASPLVHWAMRYAEAVIAIDKGSRKEARDLLSRAPQWPEESAFREYHDELLSKVSA